MEVEVPGMAGAYDPLGVPVEQFSAAMAADVAHRPVARILPTGHDDERVEDAVGDAVTGFGEFVHPSDTEPFGREQPHGIFEGKFGRAAHTRRKTVGTGHGQRALHRWSHVSFTRMM